MSRMDNIGLAIFLTVCFAFLLGVLFMVGFISMEELRLNQ